MKIKARNFSIVVYGLAITIIGLLLYIVLTIFATNQLGKLQLNYEQKHHDLAVVELDSAIKNLTESTNQLIDRFYNWEELLQQINDPTYYSYWQENRVASANFVPTYFHKLSLFDKNRVSLLNIDGERELHEFGDELYRLVVEFNENIPLLKRCMVIREVYGKNDVLGYFCVDLDLVQGLEKVQKFNYLDKDSIVFTSDSLNVIPLNELSDNIMFSVQSDKTLGEMYDVTTETITAFLLVSAVAILIFLYILVVLLGRPLRALSEHIVNLKVFGSKNSQMSNNGIFKITELDTVYEALNAYQAHLEENAEELKNSEEYFRSLIENSSDVIISVDNKGMIVYASPSVKSVLGYEGNDVVGDHIYEYIHGSDIEAFKLSANSNGKMSNEFSQYDFRFKSKSGDWLTLELAGRICADDSNACTIICRDITERKRVQNAISLAHDQALEASRAKSNFLANTSHELRTPLNAILGYTEIIAEDMKNNDISNIGEDVDKVHTAAKSLLHLIDEVLDLSKIESGKMELSVEEISVHELLMEIERTITPLMRKNNNQLEVNIAETVNRMKTDRNKLRQIIFNLLNNAAKFTHNGEVTLDIKVRRVDGRDWLDFIVTDTGVGMTTEQQEKVFEPFVQADTSTTRKYGGTGLGLTICRSFAHLMHGEINVQSEEGAGTAFTLSLPAKIRDAVERFQPRQAS